MVFTTQTFLFFFFPISIILYFIAELLEKLKTDFFRKIRFKDLIIVVFSLGFYAWSCFDDVFRLVFYILIVWLMGKWIENSKAKKQFITIESANENQDKKTLHLALIPFIISLCLLILYLVIFKYSSFLTTLFNSFLKTTTTPVSLIAPLGLSFITFSAISYLVDIYREKAKAGNIIDCALYISFFPKVISGPIVLWKDFSVKMSERKTSTEKVSRGITRIMIGFIKKVLLADTFGLCISKIGLNGIDWISALGTVLLYFLQIYYDFAGYSDIAIGISNIFGFDFDENFNFPYLSTSISEFWRRWHISLGAWFREYVYFPLGGSHQGKGKTLINLAIVFALTGIWHGAGWNYIIWGTINGFFVIIERLLKDTAFYKKIPSFVKWLFTVLIVLCFWQLFRFNDLTQLTQFINTVFGGYNGVITHTWQYYFDKQIIFFAIVGLLGATVLGIPAIQNFLKKIYSTKIGYTVAHVVLFAIFIVSIFYMVNSTYSPFIYFQY